MKFLVAIAMVALIGFSFTSAAAIDMGEDITPESMEGFEENLKKMLQEVSKQVKENADFDDMEELESFIQENKVDDDDAYDDEQTSLVTEVEENFSAIEEDKSNENVDSGIRCSWRGLSAACCQSLKVFKFRVRICLGVQILPPGSMKIILKVNRHILFRKTVGGNKKFHVCLRKGPFKLCVFLYDLKVSRHSASICIRLKATFLGRGFKERLGCVKKSFASEEISAIAEKETPLLLIEKPENAKRLLTVAQEENLNDDVLRFDH